MAAMAIVPAALQALAMLADEGYYHRRRRLPRWERLGHPLDTLTVALCYAWLASAAPSAHALTVYVVLAGFSCLFVTKDEGVHTRLCSAGEHWLHAFLFVLHPVVLAAFGWLWWQARPELAWLLPAQLTLTCLLMIYQLSYWSLSWKSR
jgi:hypothetical protein